MSNFPPVFLPPLRQAPPLVPRQLLVRELREAGEQVSERYAEERALGEQA